VRVGPPSGEWPARRPVRRGEPQAVGAACAERAGPGPGAEDSGA
jgi:hypothetical protein